MEGLEEKDGASRLMEEYLEQLRIWLLGLLMPDRWEKAASLTAHFHVDLSMVFIGFYGMLTVLCLFILVLGTKMKGLSRGMAFACVMLCLLLGGGVAGLSIIQAKSSEAQMEAAVKQMRKDYVSMRDRKAIPPIQPKSISPAEELLERIRNLPPEERLKPVPDALERHREWHRKHDDDGYLIEDDYSHERSYPKADSD